MHHFLARFVGLKRQVCEAQAEGLDTTAAFRQRYDACRQEWETRLNASSLQSGQQEGMARTETKGLSGSPVYENASQKAESFRSGAWMLIFVGVAGLILLALAIAGFLPVHLAGVSGVLSGLVMGALFVAFLISGISSLKTSRQLEGKAKEESDLREELLDWCRTHLSAEQIDASIEELPESEEERYFRRTERIRSLIVRDFMNLDEAYLESFVDEIYTEYFDAPEER